MKKHLPLVLCALSFLTSFLCLWQVFALKSQLFALQGQLSGQISGVEASVGGISSTVSGLLQQGASLLASSGYEYGELDVKSRAVSLTCRVTPKEFSPEGTRAVLMAEEEGEAREIPLTLEGGAFSATLTLPLFSECHIAQVLFYEGEGCRTENLDWYLTPRQDFLPQMQAWLAGTASMSGSTYSRKGQVDFQAHSLGDKKLPGFQEFSLLQTLNGREVERQAVDQKGEGFSVNEDSRYSLNANFPLEVSVDLAPGDTYELWLEVKDESGLCYRFWLDRWVVDPDGTGSPGEEPWAWDGGNPDIYDQAGNVLYAADYQENG